MAWLRNGFLQGWVTIARSVCVCMDSAAGAGLTGRKTMMDDGEVFTAAACKCHRGVHKASSTPNYTFL